MVIRISISWSLDGIDCSEEPPHSYKRSNRSRLPAIHQYHERANKSPSRLFLLPTQIVWQGKKVLVVIYHTVQYSKCVENKIFFY